MTMLPYDNVLADVPTDLYFGGAWRPASDGARMVVVDPATETSIASVASASVGDAKAAVAAADAASAGWASRKPRERAEILRKAYELLVGQSERFARLITVENGKPLGDARGEVAYAAEFFRWYAEEAVRNVGEISRAPSSGARIVVQHKPAGVAVLVTPWNFPAAMATRKIGPALAAGCTIVLKPASETPLTALALGLVLEEAGVPAGVVNVLPSRRSGAVVGAMLQDLRVRVVSFTGSTEVGRKLLHAAADNVVRPVMELGGNAPFIVFDDADVDAAVEGAMIAKMRNMGEACTAANRFYVHADVHDVFAAKFADRMRALKLGHGLEDGVALGPLVNAEARNKVVELVDDAVGKGARVLVGGKAPDGKGFFFPATVLSDVPDGAAMLREEIFGPVASIQKFVDTDEVIARANATEYGLVAYVYTRDLSRGMRVSEKLDFGMVGLNRGLVSDPAAPFGGMKQSGIGREGAHEGIMEFLETQYVSVNW
jgi:succinate-semialdehyde dehydrogenase / glutarate-semialdehyde dehydrogenase